MSAHFQVTDVNPNDAVGGGGCVCGDTKQYDCNPPYVVFYATETDSNLSPHVVACENCLEAALEGARALGGDTWVDGEEVIDAEVVGEGD